MVDKFHIALQRLDELLDSPDFGAIYHAPGGRAAFQAKKNDILRELGVDIIEYNRWLFGKGP